MVDTLLFPSDYYDMSKVDQDLKMEFDAANSCDLFQIIIFGYDKWFQEEKLFLNTAPLREVTAVYRGWMMKPCQYEKFYEQLLQRGIRLITNPASYERMHIFPNVYESVREDTARMRLYPLNAKIDVAAVKRELCPFMVKDYVKSVKGTQFPKAFGRDITQEEFDRWMEVFYKYRGELLTGGICLKEFLPLRYYGTKTNEYRVFYINHLPAAVSKNSAQPNYVSEPPKALINKYSHLDSPFYTVDFGELKDGTWKVLEAGDGSVSGLSEGQDYLHFFRMLYQCFQE